MQNLVKGLEQALASESWYAALALALAMPDICGRIDSPGVHSKERYVAWFNQYLLPQYSTDFGGDLGVFVFLSGEDCYALRCAYLHEGASDLANQRARQALSDVRFIAAPVGVNIHRNRSDDVLQLDVRHFCQDVLDAVLAWLRTGPAVPFDGALEIVEIPPGGRVTMRF
jgi:hypothetical protein